MPELPEVEITRRGIEPFVLGKAITGVRVRNPNLRQRVPRNIARLIVGQRVKRLSRRGKYLLFECDAGCLIVHLGMSGSLRVIEPRSPPRKHDHVDLVFGGSALRLRDPRRFGVVLWSRGDSSRHPLLARLGVEPLSEEFSPEFLYEVTRRRDVGIKQLLMNAAVVVGVGNIYASEALFRARVRPQRAAGRLSRAEVARIATAVRRVLAAAIRVGGTTLRDYVNADGMPGYFRQKLYVYERAGQPCRVCRTPVRQRLQGQRSTYWCPTCQR